MTAFRLTHHARQAMRARGISMQELSRVIARPEVRRTSFAHRGVPTPDNYVYQRGHLAAVVIETGDIPVVKTVLLYSQDQWDDTDARNRHTEKERA